jgi:hypothetical protein
MSTATAAKETPPAEVDAARQAEARMMAAQEAINLLRAEASTVSAGYSSAIDNGDLAAMTTARQRRAEIADAILINERSLLVAQVARAQAMYDEALAGMQAAYVAAQAAVEAENEARQQSFERRNQEHQERKLSAANFHEAIRSDTFDLTVERQNLTAIAGGLKSAMVEHQLMVHDAQQQLEAHRRKHALQVEA